MLVKEIINPGSIVIVGGSRDTRKPGGKILKNIIDGGYEGNIYVVNPHQKQVQGVNCHPAVDDLPPVELAIIAVPAQFILKAVKTLAYKKATKGFIILSAGFSEFSAEGRDIEMEIKDIIDGVGGTLIGPNCIGVSNENYNAVFAGLLPKHDPKGCDFVSGSGATIAFVLETAIPRGLTFNSIYSIGNSAQTSVSDILQHWDETFDPEISSRIKLIYIEQIDRPDIFLKHARSLIQKGCRIAAIKAGTTDAGSRAVSSHTGALAGSDLAVDALFKKAGIIRCFGRVELVYVAGVLAHKQLKGKNLAVITHAGGSGVMLTDTLTKAGLKVPLIKGPDADKLLTKLYHGASVANPIDFLATGTAEQLSDIIDAVENKFDDVDGSAVIFGTTGMFDVTHVYDVLHEKMNQCKKPIYPVLPSVVMAEKEVKHFLSLGRINFTDEVSLGRALAKVYFTPQPAPEPDLPEIDIKKARTIIENSEAGFIPPIEVQGLLDAAGINRPKEIIVGNIDDCLTAAEEIGYPLVMKVVGPIHKTEVGGVQLNIREDDELRTYFYKLMAIGNTSEVLLQPMLSGTELFAGVKFEPDFGHLILCGLGGIFIEVLGDVTHGLSPLSHEEALTMIRSIRAYKIIQGARKIPGVDENKFADLIVRLSALVETVPEITELDLNPILGSPDGVLAVDTRIKIEK